MVQDKKFGTFGGVFTPSILTILGVIMYLRLPWIVGQAGFFLTAGVILVAHFVSVSTGLSVASIATDKKVKAGGTYYIISRSLGLPIGGTLGVALFFGLSMSVSLYLIGFSESFLGFWGFPISKDAIRLVGTIALLVVGTLTFISTSLAIKTQYFIMAAIGLSLITIIFGSVEFVPTEPLFNPVSDMSPLIVLFAIFFPAVTGFEAGVSMSGDLQDPKKSIPVGTISAILVGLIFYIGLAAFFAFRVNADQLINNPNILIELSFFPPLLVAGIWGATLSSAIGSILGAPRILQATSSDRITPKLFAKGYGKTNEPRNALIFTFLIAEAGILIGELNLIARVVSMFFITTYGFLNLSSSLEKWASTDFRPSFKIPAAVSIGGAIVCFVLMLELDFVALIGAILIMGTIFFFLKKKELTLESGDTWEGVWASVLRSGLNRLNRTVKQTRNWRPNIILFSGGSTARPHLLEIGRWLVHKRGILSNFNLIEKKDAQLTVRKPDEQEEEEEDKFQGIFTRHMEVNEIYEGIETITKVYGFAGIEPNSVMLGWARNTKKPEKFASLLNTLNQLDYNVLVVDYNQERGFGDKKIIDLWWRGGSNNIAFGLTLIKFIQMSDDWEESEARILIVNEDSALNNRIYRNIGRVLEEHRIEAKIKIINNGIDRKPIYDIIKLESQNSDLVLLGLPGITTDNSHAYIASTAKLIDSLGSVILLDASTFFQPIYIGIEKQAPDALHKQKKAENKPGLFITSLDLPEDEGAADFIKNLQKNLHTAFSQYAEGFLSPIQDINLSLLKNFNQLVEKNFDEIEVIAPLKELHKSKKVVAKVQSNFLFNSGRIVEEYKETGLKEQAESLALGLQTLLQKLTANLDAAPADLYVSYKQNHPESLSKLQTVWIKFFRRKNFDEKKIKVRLAPLLNIVNRDLTDLILYKHLPELALNNYRLLADMQKLFTAIADAVLAIERKLDQTGVDAAWVQTERNRLEKRLKAIVDSHTEEKHVLLQNINQHLQNLLQTVSMMLGSTDVKSLIRRKSKELKKKKSPEVPVLAVADVWQNQLTLISNFFVEEIYLKKFQNRVNTIIERFNNEIQLSINTNFLDKLDELSARLESIAEGDKDTINVPAFNVDSDQYRRLFQSLIKDIQLAVEELPDSLDTMSEESYQHLDQEPFSDKLPLQVNLRHYTEFLIETELFDPLQNQISNLATALPKTVDVVQEVIRFTNYNLTPGSESGEATQESIDTVLDSGRTRLSQEKEKILQLQNKIHQDFMNILASTFDKMNPYLISRSVGELKQTIRSKESRKIVTKISDFYRRINTWSKNLIVQLIYQRSESVLFAKKIGKVTTEYQTDTGYILDLVKNLSPDSEVSRMLPFYYSQLFVDKRVVNKEFLIERKREMEGAEQAIETYKQGYNGALLLIGERYAGKSTLSRTIAARYFDKQKVFQIYAPDDGSSDPDLFKHRLSDAIEHKGNYASMFNALPQHCVLIIHDLELWWERSSSGLKVIEEIIELINMYGDKCFFIVNIGSVSYKFINQIKPIEKVFISAIECQSFDSEDLQKAILLRHRSTGLKFELQGQPEETISNLQIARLFNNYFNLSGGIVGQAIYYWLSNIIKVEPKRLKIQFPHDLNEQALDKLNTDWLVLLQQFALHKRLTPSRLVRILGSTENDLAPKIHFLKRSGLLQPLQNDILQISPYVQPHVTRRLSEMRIL